jgi:hypothetical protein
VEASEGGLTLTLAYDGTQEPDDVEARLLQVLPDVPELALLRAVLAAERMTFERSHQRFNVVERYVERVDLREAARTWESEALKLEVAAANPQRVNPELDRIAAAAWTADARRWRELAERSRAIYRITLQERGIGPDWLASQVRRVYDERGVTREWTVAAAAERELTAEVVSWRYDRLGAVVVAAVAGALLMALLLWKVVR